MEDWEKYYLGGIWDADGSFFMRKRVKRTHGFQPEASITLCDPKAKIIGEMVERNFGFKCVWSSRRDNPNWNIAYKFSLYSQRACDFASMLEPYLIIKKERAQILMEWPRIDRNTSFYDRTEIHEKQEFLYLRMKKLNKRGAD